MAPALFISHGSPMFALQPGRIGPLLARVGRRLHGVRGLVVVSPHWMTHGLWVGAATTPATLHDFGGFPAPLYHLQYPAPGAPDIADAVQQQLQATGISCGRDPQRGLDHGVWVPLRHLLPEARLPVVPLSMPADLTTVGALRLGRALAPLREAGVMVIGSGSLTHNLGEYGRPIADPEYVTTFADWVAAQVLAGDDAALVDYRRRAPGGARAHPTEEHFLPLLVALGARHADEAITRIAGGITDGILCMDAYGFGLPSGAMADPAEAGHR